MAILHQAQLKPSKLELLQAYVPTLGGLGISDGDELTLLGAYRFDDPAGDVGIETHLLATPDGRTFHIPLTYRAAPFEGADGWFVGTLEHSVLGTRWVYNGCGDTVYVSELVRTILTGDTQVKLEIETPDGPVERENTVHVRGSGRPGSDVPEGAVGAATQSGTDTVISVGPISVVVHHVVTADAAPTGPHLRGTWPGMIEPATLATITSG